MTDYTELIKALRCCVLSKPCSDCPFYDKHGFSEKCATMNSAAADAIEELQRIVSEYQKFDGFLATHGMFKQYEPKEETE